MRDKPRHNSVNRRRRSKKRLLRLDKVLIFCTGLLVMTTLALYLWPYLDSRLHLIPIDLGIKPDLVEASVSMEAGSHNIDLNDFLIDDQAQAVFLSDPQEINTSNPGTYPLQIQIGRHVYETTLKIIDTIPPAAEPLNQTFWSDELFAAADFVTAVDDVTAVQIAFVEDPDLTQAGEQEVLIRLTDQGQNETIITAQLHLLIDTEPPVIEGVKDQAVFTGSTIMYSQGVAVTDNRDPNIQLEIDNSKVNLREEGVYPVVYSAADQAGNRTSQTVMITVVEYVPGSIDPNELNELADQILADLVSIEMTEREQAEAIYWWTKGHIRYVNESDKSSWLNAAYQGINDAYGDCFNYFAAAKILLTRAGIENVDVLKTGGGHYWNMINLGDGWYHFDTTPRKDGGEFFMLTDAELQAYADAHNESHIWDRDLYPATPEDG